MDIEQSTCIFGHRCTLCDQWWRTWYVLCILPQLNQTFTPHHRRAPYQLSRTYWRTFRQEYGSGCMGDNGALWPHWEGEFSGLSLSSPVCILRCSQIIAIVMDNASNNNTMMSSIEWRCQQRGIQFSVQDARMRCMPHTIHLVAIKVLHGWFTIIIILMFNKL